MDIKKLLVSSVERLTSTRIYPTWKLPRRGIDLYEDLAELPIDMEVAFDVGANVGQTAQRFLREFPRATIYSFEPVAATFRRLQSMTHENRLRAYQLALGAEKGTDKVVHQGTDDMFSLLGNATAPDDANVEEVVVDTLDSFCRQEKIERINFLKIDTEGADLDVLFGAQQMLDTQQVDALQVEAGMNCKNNRHVPFETFKAFLEPKGYYLFGVYDQVAEWPTRQPHLRRTNSVFISERVIHADQPRSRSR